MSFNSPIRNLAPLLLLILFTAYAPFASADPTSVINEATENCAAKLLPQALNLENVRPDSFTAHADHFMKALWPAMSRGENVLEARSVDFTTFVANLLPEMIQNHARNRLYAQQDLITSFYEKRIEQILEKHLSFIDSYISKLQERISKNEQLSYLDLLQFCNFLTVTREPEANRKFKALYDLNDEAAVQNRYPGKKRQDMQGIINQFSTPEFKQNFWLRLYSIAFKTNLMVNDKLQILRPQSDVTRIVTQDQLQRILLIPSVTSPGPVAFYLNYHLPINPLALSSEYELLDNVNFASPLANFAHDVGHFFNLITRPDIDKLDAIRADLKMIREIVISKQDPELLQTLYYMIYFLRFETQLPIPLTSEKLAEHMQYLADYVTNFGSQPSEQRRVSGGIHILFRNSLLSPFAPARSETIFDQKMAKIIAITSMYNLDKSSLSLSEKMIERVKVWKQHLHNIRQGQLREKHERKIREKQKND